MVERDEFETIQDRVLGLIREGWDVKAGQYLRQMRDWE
jgi:hypothetical protein